jgi:tRNA/tmRNA/rRNA uracil-C5-methylase (TrmA/RlmC/RlmD family)
VRGERIRLTVGAVAHGGHCVARHDGRVIFVRHALPGEVVTVEVTEGGADAKFWRADAVEIHEPSPDRVPSAWPEAGAGGVGGGELAHVALPAQRAWKLAVLREAFERFAGPTQGATDFPSDEVRAAPLGGDGTETGGGAGGGAAVGGDAAGGLGYRTRVSAVAGPDGRASMRAFRSHAVRRLDRMPLATAAAEEALLAGHWTEGATIDVVNASGEDKVRVLVDGRPWTGRGVDRRPNAPSHVREVVTVGGQEHAFRVAAGAFWQVHREAATNLAREVVDRVGDAGAVLDLYAGSGLFTLPLAATGREVSSVESDPQAAKDARRNLHAHPAARVIEGDVRQMLHAGLGRYDAVVLDPPRSGAGRATLEALHTTGASTLVYVACDPVALARDVAILRDLGYALESATAWDLFPMTHHIETVATFRRG